MEGAPRDHEHEKIARRIEKAGSNEEVSEAIRSCLNYWELLSNGVRLKVFDFEAVSCIAGSRVRDVCKNYAPYRDERRRQPKNNSMYEGIEWLARKPS
jgi:hypothetical protein